MSAALVALARRADEWVFGAESPARLRWTHAGLAALIGLRVALGPYRGLAGQAPALFDPPWFLRVLPAMPPEPVIVALQLAGVLGVVAFLAARRPRLAFALALACYLVLVGLRASRGKIQHNDLLLVFVAVPFLVAPLDTRGSDCTPSTRYGWPIRVAMIVIATAYFRAGVAKVLSAGVLWVFSDNMRWILYSAASREPLRAPTDALAVFVADRAWLATLTAAALVTFELTFPLVLFLPRVRPLFVIAAFAFHAGTWLTIGLDYWTWAAVDALVLVDWSVMVGRYSGARSASSASG